MMEIILRLILTILVTVGGYFIMSGVFNENPINVIIGFLIGCIACGIVYIYDLHQHNDNCTCEKCQQIAVKEYCPCGCGQYEIVYR